MQMWMKVSVLPADLDYEKQIPVVLHRAIFGTFDRFTAFLIEETKGCYPIWLAPTQVNIIPVNNEYHLEYADKVYKELKDNGIRVNLDDREEKLGYKMRESQTKKIPLTLILGDQERDNETISYRLHGEKETTTLSLDEFVSKLNDVIQNKKNNF